jgi:hypothetical protein
LKPRRADAPETKVEEIETKSGRLVERINSKIH